MVVLLKWKEGKARQAELGRSTGLSLTRRRKEFCGVEPTTLTFLIMLLSAFFALFFDVRQEERS